MATAAGGHSTAPQEKTFKLPCGVLLTVYSCDIFQTDADGLVTGEDAKMRGEGMISKILLQHCPKQYKEAREELLKKSKGRLKMGSVYPLPFYGDRGSKLKFRDVYHAVVPRPDHSWTKRGWKNQMKDIYFSIIQKADLNETHSLALPLLGSGGAGASKADAEEVFHQAVMSFQPQKGKIGSLKKIALYLPGKEVFNSMVDTLSADKSLVKHDIRKANGPKGQRDGHKHVGKRHTGRAAADRKVYPKDESNLFVILNDMCVSDGKNAEEAEEAAEEQLCSAASSEGEEEEDSSDEEKAAKENHEEKEEEKCAICLDLLEDPKKLDKCGHTFCQSCIEDTFKHHKPACPTCNTVYGVITGNQPLSANISVSREHWNLPGYENHGTLVIDYDIPSGVQGKEHPNPGQPYFGTRRRAFLPDCEEGRKVGRLLIVAFENRLIFTIGTSNTTGRENVVTWNDIHHKTSITGGSTGFGYPDPHYLSRVQEELAAKGVTEECLEDRNFDF